MVSQRGQINRTFWVLIPCFRVNPSVERYFSIKCLSTCKIGYPRSSKKARWTDSPLKASVCSRLKPRMAWLFTYQSSCFSASHQTIHCLIVLENRFTSASGTDSKSDMNAALGASSVKAQIMSWEIFFLVFSSQWGARRSKALVLTLVAAISSGVSVISSVTALGLTLVIGICGTWVHVRFCQNWCILVIEFSF